MMFEIRWINAVKRHGLFATKDIEVGAKIFEEPSVMVNLNEFKKLMEHLNAEKEKAKAKEKEKGKGKEKNSIPKSMRRNVKALAQKIYHGMQDLQEIIKDETDYDMARKIHEGRLKSDDIVDPDVEDPALISPRPWMPTDLYMQILNIKPNESEDDTITTVKEDLQMINTFLHGSTALIRPAVHVWTPHSRYLNHGCKPTAVLSCAEKPGSDDESVGVLALHAIFPIKQHEEITIEYYQAFGTYEQRRQYLRWYGIANCTCYACKGAEAIARQAETGDEAAVKTHLSLIAHGNELHRLMVLNPLNIDSRRPADFYQTFLKSLSMLEDDRYRGYATPTLYDQAMAYARKYNDNIRLYYIASYLLSYSEHAFGKSHEGYAYAKDLWQASLEGKHWNNDPAYKDYLTLCHVDFEIRKEYCDLVCMMEHDPYSSTYHLLTVTVDGYLAPISFEENLALVRPVMVRRGKEEEEKAEVAAAALVKEEDEEAARKEKAARKKKEKKAKGKEKKRAAAAAAEAAAREEEKRKEEEEEEEDPAAVVVDAVPAVAAVPCRSRSPCVCHSSSFPELAVVARFYANKPLQGPPRRRGRSVGRPKCGGVDGRWGF